MALLPYAPISVGGLSQGSYTGSSTEKLPVVILWGADGTPMVMQAPGTGISAASAVPTLAVPHLANGASYDAQQNNVEGTLLTSGARTANTRSPNLTNYNNKGVYVFLSITAVPSVPGSGGLQVQICAGSGADGHQYGILPAQPATPLTAVGGYAFLLYPHMTPGPITNAAYSLCGVVSAPLSRTWGAYVVHNDAQSYTYSLSYCLEP